MKPLPLELKQCLLNLKDCPHNHLAFSKIKKKLTLPKPNTRKKTKVFLMKTNLCGIQNQWFLSVRVI
jgi:hypothetical protein